LSNPDLNGAPPAQRLYGRRRGKPLRKHRQALVDTLLPRLAVSLVSERIDPAALFATKASGGIWLEVGFGKGEHLAAQAAANPAVGIIGCEPYLTGVAGLLSEIEARRLDNVRILVDDARALIARLPAACLSRVFVLFPDPWPKARHHKRRFIQPATLEALARVMADGAELRFATDHRGYCRAALAGLSAHPAFVWTAERAADWRARPDDWPATRYEAKAAAQGRSSVYLRFTRRARGQQGA